MYRAVLEALVLVVVAVAIDFLANAECFVKNLPGTSRLSSGFRHGRQAHTIPVSTSAMDQSRVVTTLIVALMFRSPPRVVILTADATAANMPKQKRQETRIFSFFGMSSFQKKGRGRMQRTTSVKTEKEVEK